MTIDEHRDEARHLAKCPEEEPGFRISYDHEAVALMALAVENKDLQLIDTVERMTSSWLEGEDDKGDRDDLLQALSNHFEGHD